MDSKHKHGGQPGSVSVVEVNGQVPANSRRRSNYAPFVSRTPFLLFICCIALACIGALQFAIKRSVPIPQPTLKLKIKRHIEARARPVITTTTPWGYALPMSTALNAQVPRQDLSQPTTSLLSETTTTPAPNEMIDPSSGTSTGYSGNYAPTTGFVELESTTTSSTSSEGAGGAAQSSFVELGASTTGYPAPPTTAYIEGTSSSQGDQTMSKAPSAYIEITQVSVNQQGQTITSVESLPRSEVTYATLTSSFTGRNGIVSTTLIVTPAQKTDGVFPALIGGAEVQIPIGTFGQQHYIYATYGGTFIAVILKILWACVYSGNKMMEPFYQLNRRAGASAKESLMADYLSSGISWWSLKIMFRGHWTMLLTVLVSLLISFLPSFATEAMTVRATGMCKWDDGSIRRCNPIWVLDINMVRVLQTFLSLIVFCIIIIVFINLRRSSGVSSNPSSIASMAALLHHPEMVREIQSIKMEDSNEDIAAKLANNRYIIGTWRDIHGHERTGIMKASVDFNHAPVANSQYRVEYAPVDNPADVYKRPLSRDAVDKLIDGSLVFLVISVLAVTLAFWFDGSESGFNVFFKSDKFGPRFLLTTAASLIAMCWLDLEREVRILSPYRKLAKRNADAKQTILATVDGYPYMSLFGSLRRGNFFHFMVSLAAVFSDLLIIAVGSVPFSSAQMRWSFVAGTWITVAVLAFMVPVIIGLFWWRRTNRKLAIPYQPNETLLRTWMGIANEGNQIRSMLDGWHDASKKERNDHCLAQEETYWAGWIRDVDGMERWCVDKEGSRVLMEYQPYRPS